MSLADFVPFTPEIFLALAGFVVLIAGIPLGRRGARPAIVGAVAALALTAVLVLALGRPAAGPQQILGDMLVIDGLAVFFKLLVLAVSAAALLLSAGFIERSGYSSGEFSALVLFADLGMFVMASSANLATLYVGVELMALSVYILVGYFKLELKSNEGAVKYFVIGAASSAVLLYGISLVYGTTGSLDLETIRSSLAEVPHDNILLLVGIVLIAFAILFKVAAVPFHVWTPDAYEGAPTPVTAFISVAPKAAAFALFIRLFAGTFAGEVDSWGLVLWLACAATLVYGTLAAMTQDNVKRLLAYSSISHAGYTLMGVVAASDAGTWAVMVHMAVYALMNLGGFGVVILLESKGYADVRVDDFAGLARRHPGIAAAMLIFLLSLGGIPPTAGFMGKLYLWSALLGSGFVGLTVISVATSAASLYYYLRIVVQMYLREDGADAGAPVEPLRDRWAEAVIAGCALLTLAVGVWPAPLVSWAKTGLDALGLV
ncbi:MAG: NADH-quinone oxidoreductase subunit N [Thermoanaerobaculales bacterium]|jgi:NADH-quinone oxidoreductase subunit N|nr:NADH-quinone oxidoreductase subunit N [Thermoanaerobaculales bacterium]